MVIWPYEQRPVCANSRAFINQKAVEGASGKSRDKDGRPINRFSFEGMTYFYDKQHDVCISVDPDTGAVIELTKLSIMAVGTADNVPEAQPVKRPYKKRDKSADGAAAPKTKGKRTTTCKKCGVVGHIAKTCKNTSTTETVGEREIDKTVLLTEEQFLDVMQEYNDGVSIPMVRLSYPKIEMSELRRAVKCLNYEEYVKGQWYAPNHPQQPTKALASNLKRIVKSARVADSTTLVDGRERVAVNSISMIPRKILELAIKGGWRPHEDFDCIDYVSPDYLHYKLVGSRKNEVLALAKIALSASFWGALIKMKGWDAGENGVPRRL
jgi:hypothetical protein